jgi:hypothetical protein
MDDDNDDKDNAKGGNHSEDTKLLLRVADC